MASPAALAFGTVRFRAGASAAVTVSDPNGAPLELGPATVTPSSGDRVAIAQDSCAALLEPDETCTITIDLTAVAGGRQGGVLSQASDQGTLSVPITATVPSVSSLEPHTQTRFVPAGPIPGAVQATRAVQPRRLVLALRNPLDAPVHIAGARLSGPGRRGFAIRADGCARVTVRPGAGCRLSVWWPPGRPARVAGTWLTVTGEGTPLIVTLRAAARRRDTAARVRGGAI